jgi:TIR domain
MSDIFISYASEDRAKAKALADALGRQNWTVWWDRKIPPGKKFDAVIEEALDSARCVVVLWSTKSVSSDWTANEAAEGSRRGILVPALIEQTKIPLGFRRIQAADLTDWRGTSPHVGFEALVTSIAAVVGTTVSTDSKVSARAQPPDSSSQSLGPSAAEQVWRAELVSTAWSKRILRVRLSNDVHLVEYRLSGMYKNGETVTVDGVVVAQGGTGLVWVGKWNFQLSDGNMRYPATIEAPEPIWPYKLRPCRLTVAGHLLYSE